MDILVEGILSNNKRVIAQTISKIDNEDPVAREILKKIYPKTGKAVTIGFTGPAGAGKSTLIGKLIPFFKNFGLRIAILAVDPTSPITGGAILGDRVRMPSTMDDDDVFMRSLGSRGAQGGISKSLRNVIRVLDAAGYDLILVESVGAGQLEVEISKVVNLTIVIFNPNTGDNVQAIKAGLTEIGDIYLVNKADLIGSHTLYLTLLDLVGQATHKPLIFKVSANTGEGLEDFSKKLVELIRTDTWLAKKKQKERSDLETELKSIVIEEIKNKSLQILDSNNNQISKLVNSMSEKLKDPYTAAEELSLLVFHSK
ncbi:methylmalonyl Co-A mutase-associated GTPase MeaB [Candidatus Nitrosocosmicus franklandus]|uniref:Putative enzyme n=1 Tax=Candidatus Nitrosocosmicus franklandianus TaxID=1798806 RepID=A0A484IHC5_9ARCH|nr:methylmalonyl Co-A mutase-associated GTPase MeaB [Candidatus Nitrosocosmicus franklandus]VFJ15422.1 putative enzyme [Candidatus Nitrosocosmicus franklandus]